MAQVNDLHIGRNGFHHPLADGDRIVQLAEVGHEDDNRAMVLELSGAGGDGLQ